ncbi:uncharacterized protein LOC125559097 [Nematostella vectensis]|uniref:uncharacterized protein LOC125559097 n=1 Tax=Nematostella vectensis TaxID=45351 RepID=UPI0020772FE6|nr:uncharacterized protein LOC125559097 [Nematostella vectensis]
METILVEKYAKQIVNLDFDQDALPVKCALGVQWCVESDLLGFRIALSDKPMTRRGILSTVSSVYDPLGLLAPYILPAKKLLQDLCKLNNLGWDDEIPSEYQSKWTKWRQGLPVIEKVTVDRCYKPRNFGQVVSKQVHIFSDPSTIGYASVAYLRMVNNKGEVHCSFLMGKARLTPATKTMTVPRLELTVATLSVRLGQLLKKELGDESGSIMYQTGSTTVLSYIANEQKRFKVYVANRIQVIRDSPNPAQWKFVQSKDNPADDGSRGMDAGTFSEEQRWLHGPDSLWKDEGDWPSQSKMPRQVSEDDPEVKQEVTSNVVGVEEPISTVVKLIEHFSTFPQNKIKQVKPSEDAKFAERHHHGEGPLAVRELEDAEIAVIKFVQAQAFPNEIEALSHAVRNQEDSQATQHKSVGVGKASSISRLDPFMANGMLRVGGRLRRADIPEESKYPVILPKKGHVTKLLIRLAHCQLGHAGRNHVIAHLRNRYWIIAVNAATRSVLHKCVTCRRIRSPVCEQKMADLPAPPFTHIGMDFFGPFSYLQGRKTMKSYGTPTRASRRHTVSPLAVDQCEKSDLVGASEELRKAVEEIKDEEIRSKLLK